MEHLVEPAMFFQIPIEIRLVIYELLFDDCGNSVFEIRSEPPDVYAKRGGHLRTSYRVLGPGIQRRACTTTYQLATAANLHTNILAANRQIHDEASYLIYGRHSFGFDTNTEAVVPFLSDLRPSSRNLVRSLSITKQPGVYSRDFDRCEWRNVCTFLTKSMDLQKLTLRVIGGRPLRDWEPTSYTAEEFRTLARAGYDSMDWVQELLAVRSLKELDIIPDVRLCPPPSSTAMEFFAAFSASISSGFTDYLRSEMISVAG